ncbi:MAG: hypothetical protein RI894_67, partial [Bacteroidota bacterium]
FINEITGGLAIPTVLINDTKNGTAILQSEATLSLVGTLPTGITFNTITGAVGVNPLTPADTYTFVYNLCEAANPSNCDLATVTVIVSPVGSVGNYVWNDLNNNGINDDGSAGINGLTIELWNANTNILVSTTTTANNGSGVAGYYNFIIATSGNYKIKFPTTYTSKILTTQTAAAATDNNSDADTTTGFSPTFTINTNGAGNAKDNTTIDAGFICPGGCVTVTIIKN